ncbi:transposase (plasmid) [Vibrio coralliilyticus]|nr:transposase [Vibrio coralliilyticus]
MKRMLETPHVYLYRQAVDFRKSINGLAAIVESDTALPLCSGALFLFTNRSCGIKSKYYIGTPLDLLCGINV